MGVLFWEAHGEHGAHAGLAVYKDVAAVRIDGFDLGLTLMVLHAPIYQVVEHFHGGTNLLFHEIAKLLEFFGIDVDFRCHFGEGEQGCHRIAYIVAYNGEQSSFEPGAPVTNGLSLNRSSFVASGTTITSGP